MSNKNPNQSLMSFDNISAKFNDSTATVDELRLAMFAPVSKFPANSKTIINLKKDKKIIRSTNWGKIEIEKTPLSQVHRDILDCILTYGKVVKPLDGANTVAMTFSAREILKKYYGDHKSGNIKFLEDRLTDMMSSIINIRPNNGDFAKFQILSFVGFKKELNSFYLEFHPKYAEFFAKSLTINYEESLEEILQIKEPIIKAIVRLALTHKSQFQMRVYDPTEGTGKTGILEAIGYPIESPSMKKRAFKILKDNVDTLKSFGIYYNPEEKSAIRYKKNANIRFIPANIKKHLISKGDKEENMYIKLQEFILCEFIYRDEKFTISDIILDTSISKIIVSSYLSSDETKEIKKLELPDIPTDVYNHLSDTMVKD